MLFFACFCARQRAQRLRAELTLAQIRKSYQTAGPIDTIFVQIHLGMDIYAKQIEPQDKRGISGGFRGSQIQVWEDVKRLDRLTPNLAHI